MSSLRSRRAGKRISTVLTRYSKSCLNLPSVTACSRFSLVAQIKRISISMTFEPPTGVICLFCSAASSLTCWLSGKLPSSSKNKLPPWASSNRPMRSSFAPVNAPFLWPNSSLSNRLSASDPISRLMKGWLWRWLALWIAWAVSSFPVPLSPLINMLASVLAALSITEKTCCMASLWPKNSNG